MDAETRLITKATMANLWPTREARDQLDAAARALPGHALAVAAQDWLARHGSRADARLRDALAKANAQARTPANRGPAAVVQLHRWQTRADLA
jgi:hypothetical protein